MKEAIKLLVVEDDLAINELLCDLLRREGYTVRGAYSGTEAKMCVQLEEYHLILLDLMLPGMTGEELIVDLRKDKMMPIIVISAKVGQDTKIEALKMGADDFMSKPFDTAEVIARVEAQLRRYTVFSQVVESKVYKHKNLQLDVDAAKVSIDGNEVALTAREYKILELLMSYPKKVFTRANLFEHVWNDEFLGDDNTVNVHISNLRNKLGKVDGGTDYIQTVWGIGFKMHDEN
ncbi:MAG: response regulator transcription factor [Cellulosilyticaceae bacterium]